MDSAQGDEEKTSPEGSIGAAEIETSEEQPSTSAAALVGDGATRDLKKILSSAEYNTIIEFMAGTLESDRQMLVTERMKIDPRTLEAIMLNEMGKKEREQYASYEHKAPELLRDYEEMAAGNGKNTLFRIALREHLSPVVLCQLVLQQKYGPASRIELVELITQPTRVKDQLLKDNVEVCVHEDALAGPVLDDMRKELHELHSTKIKTLCAAAGLHFVCLNNDETELRFIRPFMFRGVSIKWIDGRAAFGDVQTHKALCAAKYIKYCQRYGSGIVLYWLGMQTATAKLPENDNGIIVMAEFPNTSDLIMMN